MFCGPGFQLPKAPPFEFLKPSGTPFFVENMPILDEVSIGHALISESLFLGLEETISRYKNILK